MTPYIPLQTWDLALASSLLLIDAALSLALRLGITRPLLLAALRMVVQLCVLALVLEGLFQAATPTVTGLACLVMVACAGYEINRRQERRLRNLWGWGLGSGAMFFSTVAISLFALTTQINPDPWWNPRYALPLLGMILGNAMNGISLGLNTLTTQAHRERTAIEAYLALGVTRWHALLPLTRAALRSGLMSVINNMTVAGLVFIPGIMTGQLMSGVPPLDAAYYQILIILLIAGAVGLGTLLAILGGVWRLTDTRHRLRLDRLTAAPGRS